MQIAMSPTRERYPLSTTKVLKKTISSTIVWLLIFGFLGVLSLIGSVASNPKESPIFLYLGLGTVFVFVFIVSIVWLYQRWYYAVYYYELTDRYIVIRKGPITPTEVTIPYERVQDVYVDQDLLDRMFGLYDVHLASATASSGIEAHIDGVEKEAADGLRALLLERVMDRIGKKAEPSEPHTQTSV